MPKLFRVLIYIICGTITGAIVWGLIVESIILALDLKHGEGFASIPSPFLAWLALIVGGLNGLFIGMTLGSFGTAKILKGALLAAAATIAVTIAYYLLIDPGFFVLSSSGSSGSGVALRNLAGVAVILASPSPVIGIITTFISSLIWKKFEAKKQGSLLPDDL